MDLQIILKISCVKLYSHWAFCFVVLLICCFLLHSDFTGRRHHWRWRTAKLDQAMARVGPLSNQNFLFGVTFIATESSVCDAITDNPVYFFSLIVSGYNLYWHISRHMLSPSSIIIIIKSDFHFKSCIFGCQRQHKSKFAANIVKKLDVTVI